MIACKGIHYAFLYDYIRKATKKKIVKKTQKLGSVTIFSYICGRIHKMMQQMNKKDKLLKRFYSQPKDFTFDEMVSVFPAMDSIRKTKEQLLVQESYLSMTQMAIATLCINLILPISLKDML